MSGELTLREATKDDAPSIRGLLAAEFPANPKAREDVWRWQYERNPFGAALSWVWDDGGEVVAHMARIPVPLNVDGRPVRAVTSVDGATRKSHRGQGLATALGDAANAGSVAAGVRIAFHFRAPGRRLPQGSAPAIAPLRRYMVPLDAAWLASNARLPALVAKAVMWKLGAATPASSLEVEATPDGISDLWGAVADRARFGLRRDATWWRWRYDERPGGGYRFFALHRRGRLVAAAVAVPTAEGSILSLLELMAVEPSDAETLVRSVAASAEGFGALDLVATPRSAWAELARAAGMVRVPRFLDNSVELYGRVLGDGGQAVLASPWAVVRGDMDHL